MSSSLKNIPVHPQSIRVLDGLVSIIFDEKRPTELAQDLGFLVFEECLFGDPTPFWDAADQVGGDPIDEIETAMIQEVIAREAIRAFKPTWDVAELSGTCYVCYRALRASGTCDPVALEACAAERMALIRERYKGVFEATWLYAAIAIIFQRSFVVPRPLEDL